MRNSQSVVDVHYRFEKYYQICVQIIIFKNVIVGSGWFTLDE